MADKQVEPEQKIITPDAYVLQVKQDIEAFVASLNVTINTFHSFISKMGAKIEELNKEIVELKTPKLPTE